MKTLEDALIERQFIRRRNTIRYRGHAIPEAIRQMLWKELMEQEAEYFGQPSLENSCTFESVQAEIQAKIRECQQVIIDTRQMIERLQILKTQCKQEETL